MTKKYFSAQQLDLFTGSLKPPAEVSDSVGNSAEIPSVPVIMPRADVSAPVRSSEGHIDIETCLPKIWRSLVREFFPDAPRLNEYQVVWSNRRQIRTLASCSLERKRIRVARELKYMRHYQWLAPLLYHEMCHAYLGYSIHNKHGRTAWHGPEFRALEAKHPLMETFNRWVHTGGWATAVRSERSKTAHATRKKSAKRRSRAS